MIQMTIRLKRFAEIKNDIFQCKVGLQNKSKNYMQLKQLILKRIYPNIDQNPLRTMKLNRPKFKALLLLLFQIVLINLKFIQYPATTTNSVNSHSGPYIEISFNNKKFTMRTRPDQSNNFVSYQIQYHQFSSGFSTNGVTLNIDSPSFIFQRYYPGEVRFLWQPMPSIKNATHTIFMDTYLNDELISTHGFNFLQNNNLQQLIRKFQITQENQMLTLKVQSCQTYYDCLQYAIIDENGNKLAEVDGKNAPSCHGKHDIQKQWNYKLATAQNLSFVAKSICYSTDHPKSYSTVTIQNKQFCKGIQDSSGKSINQTTCECNSGFTYNQIQRACQRDCTKYKRAKGLVLGSNKDCQCQFFSWDPLLLYCPCHQSFDRFSSNDSCKRNCGLIRYSTQKLKLNSLDQCECIKFFRWNTQKAICQRDCKILLYALGSHQLFSDTCICIQGYYWDQILHNCKRNCSLFSKSSGNLRQGYIDQCQCQAGFEWNTKKKDCQRQITCPDFRDQNIIQISSCNSFQGYFFNPTTRICTKCHKSCSSCVGAGKNECCSCKAGYDYSIHQGKCQQSSNIIIISILATFLAILLGIVLTLYCCFIYHVSNSTYPKINPQNCQKTLTNQELNRFKIHKEFQFTKQNSDLPSLPNPQENIKGKERKKKYIQQKRTRWPGAYMFEKVYKSKIKNPRQIFKEFPSKEVVTIIQEKI